MDNNNSTATGVMSANSPAPVPEATDDNDMDMVEEPSGPAPPARDSFVHDSAVVDDGAIVGAGTEIGRSSHVTGGARIGKECSFGQNTYVGGKVVIGDNVKVENGVSIFDGVEIGDGAFLGPHCTFTNPKTPRSFINRPGEYNKTVVEKGATIGANATIICGNTIGKYSFVGAGAVVTDNVPNYACVVGNPAKFKYWISEAGAKLEKYENYKEKVMPGQTVMYCKKTDQRYSMMVTGTDTCIMKGT